MENQEDAELETIRKITTDKQLDYKFINYIKSQYTIDQDFILAAINKKRKYYI